LDEAIFDRIQQNLREALGDILDAYAVAGLDPAEHTVDGFAFLFDCSRRNLESWPRRSRVSQAKLTSRAIKSKVTQCF